MDGQKTAWPYIKGYKFNRLFLKNFAYVFILVTLPLLLVLSLNYSKFQNVVNNRIMDTNEELLQKNAVVTDNTIEGLLDTLDKMSRQEAVVDAVQTLETDTAYHKTVAEVVKLIETHAMSNNFVTSTYIYSDVNDMLIDSSGAQHIDQVWEIGKWYDLYKHEPMFYPYILVNQTDSIFVCQPIWSAKGQRSGLLVLDVELQKLRDLLESQDTSQHGIFFITDISGQTIYCNEQDYAKWDEARCREYESDIAGSEIGQTRIVEAHGNRIVSVMESVHKSWRYAYVTQMPDYKEENAVVRGFLLSGVIVGVVSSIIVAYLITVLTYRPVKKIISVIQNPQLHWDETEASKPSNELLYITSNILADRAENEEPPENLEERIRALRQAQFRALQFQIDPHFLYNTLETIKWNAVEEIGLGNKTSKMLTKVARLYRMGLENDDVIITLKEEIEFLKLYIEIVGIRFGDSITFHWNIDESLYDCTLIKMCLQPIVENAIQHGLRPKNYRGNITISAYYKEECLYISVEDDGQSINQKDLDALNKKLKTGAGFEENKVGLRNVNERIKLIYGKNYGVSIHSNGPENETETEASVRVVLTFPCRNFNRSEETK
ncbi:MAG: hypothetical protein E7421_03080 [Ruminococcaceae bacterium]|nr:hypothetical protein [Oscillospiraceae bacterium]